MNMRRANPLDFVRIGCRFDGREAVGTGHVSQRMIEPEEIRIDLQVRIRVLGMVVAAIEVGLPNLDLGLRYGFASLIANDSFNLDNLATCRLIAILA
jgi:hypothetical protein